MKTRILTIDIARCYAMALVFYAHFIERVMYLQNPTAAAHYKFINSFHMVLFFILAGYVASARDLQLSFDKYLKHRAYSRLLPFVFFTFLFMVLPVFFNGDFFQLQLPTVQGYREGLINTVFGLPMFCIPSWFLLMIFSVEMVHYGAFRFLKTDAGILVGAAVFYVAGYVLNWQIDLFNPVKGRVVGWNYLFIHEAITMYGFYLLGVYLQRKDLFKQKMAPLILSLGIAISFLIVLFTYRLNTGLFSFAPFDTVVILFSSHGHFIWFPVTAIAGSFLVLFIARATPAQQPLLWLGRNTLILMCLNGIFYHYINPPAAKWVVDHLSGSPLTVLGVGCAVTIGSLIFCMPLIYVFNRYLPQLVGKPKIKGPLLNNLLPPSEA